MILNQQHEVRVARGPLESFLRRVKRELGLSQSDVTICLISDKAMARLNQDFRKKKGPTDVLSFPHDNSFSARRRHRGKQRSKGRKRIGMRHDSEKFSPLIYPERSRRVTRPSPLYLGDIAISPATAKRYAKDNGRHLAGELRVLILHGVLHLLGYDHETDRGEMDAIEQRLRKRFGLM
ncbi:MAG TPA: rRNA maturation RNase YbeY [Candidatus Acidoferrum sp.]|nr:rRNA maturation RNase YbeY [Candidatus Acidoferrum sp.]